MQAKNILIIIVFAAMLFLQCESKDKDIEQAAEDMKTAAEKMADAGRKMGESMGDDFEDMADALKKMGRAIGNEVDVEPVDFRELKKVLPRKMAGMKMVDWSGEKNALLGIKVSEARAEYKGRGDATLEVTITDLGTVKGFGKFASLGWAIAEIDKETETGYERTIEFKGHKGYEEYDEEDEEGKIELIVAGRFTVEIKGRHIRAKTLRDGLDDIDVDQLEDWKDRGITI